MLCAQLREYGRPLLQNERRRRHTNPDAFLWVLFPDESVLAAVSFQLHGFLLSRQPTEDLGLQLSCRGLAQAHRRKMFSEQVESGR
mmetsp:Transcript_43352/g.94149  ORF Transcript_43352/g.94149 Transcript_43352/m.94149 type:complete len:86 (-) Transcript_43352:366-623(-)